MNPDSGQSGKGEALRNSGVRHPRLNQAAAALAGDEPETAYRLLVNFLAKHPKDFDAVRLMAETAMRTSRFAEAVTHYRRLVEESPASGELLIRYGHSLRSTGMRNACIAAYRKAIALSPARGDAWWALASLRTVRFMESDIGAMQAQLARSDLTPENRIYLQFALGKAHGDLEHWANSFDNYARANALRRLGVAYDPEAATARVRALEATLTSEFFRRRAGWGCDSRDPIFIVGMQRSGSTLIEQILAGHSAIEALGELPDIPSLAKDFGSDALGTLDARTARSLGERHLKGAGTRRQLHRQFFVDKQPYNFWHIGLIHLILPNARIIDARRHPLGCCFSNFTTPLSHAQNFSSRQSDLGRYYTDYERLMAHFDRVLPGKIHRVIYERLVTEPEREVRRLLDHLGLPFEDACLRFYMNDRALDSASSDQVRTPLYPDALERWRHYEQWLGPLKAVLEPGSSFAKG